ncbi:hypothetical protein TNCV_4217751 [Trichonephila clavipes]|nr:hypothetical protein TNCV_4217751 [Trichonephila clavipes]
MAVVLNLRRPSTYELHDLSNHHERFKRPNGIFADEFRTSCRLRETKRYSYRYLSPSHVDSRDGRTFTQPQEFFQGLVLIDSGHDQEKGGNGK